MKNLVLKTLALVFVSSLAYAEAPLNKSSMGGGVETLGVEKNTDLKNLDWRIFASIGLGASLGYKFEYTPNAKAYYLFTLTEYLAGAEFIFSNGNGFNIYGSAEGKSSKLITIGANYVYESTSPIKWAVLTGLDTGIEANGLSQGNPYVLRYNLGVRLRKNRHAVSLNVKVPLFDSEVSKQFIIEKPAVVYTQKMKVYTGVVPTIRYTYFFGL